MRRWVSVPTRYLREARWPPFSEEAGVRSHSSGVGPATSTSARCPGWDLTGWMCSAVRGHRAPSCRGHSVSGGPILTEVLCFKTLFPRSRTRRRATRIGTHLETQRSQQRTVHRSGGGGWGGEMLLRTSHAALTWQREESCSVFLEKVELSVAPREEQLSSTPRGRAPPIQPGFPSR